MRKSNVYNAYVPLFTVILESGVRCGELIGLTWNDVDMKNAKDPSRNKKNPIIAKSVQCFCRAEKAELLPRISAHNLQHTACTNMARQMSKKKWHFLKKLQTCKPAKIKGLQKLSENFSTHHLTVLTISVIVLYRTRGKEN